MFGVPTAASACDTASTAKYIGTHGTSERMQPPRYAAVDSPVAWLVAMIVSTLCTAKPTPAPQHAPLMPPSLPPRATRPSTTIARIKLAHITIRVRCTAWTYAIADHVIGRNTVITLRIVSSGPIPRHSSLKIVFATVGAIAPRPTPNGETTRP